MRQSASQHISCSMTTARSPFSLHSSHVVRRDYKRDGKSSYHPPRMKATGPRNVTLRVPMQDV
jgi:hypothetical protein